MWSLSTLLLHMRNGMCVVNGEGSPIYTLRGRFPPNAHMEGDQEMWQLLFLEVHLDGRPARFGRPRGVGVLLSGSPRGIPWRVVMSRDSPRSERDGARNTKIQTGSGRRSVIPYVLCGGLYCLRCCSMFLKGSLPAFI